MSLFATVKEVHATAEQLNTLAHADTPGAVPEQLTVKATPELEEYPSSQLTKCVSVVEPDNNVVSLFATVKEEQATAEQDNTLDHADTPGATPEQVLVNAVPELEVYPSEQLTK